ncbi:MAG: hypothetical protein EAZ11_10385 [Curvibacter sp.]|nr:MAG: hypothetical protein EAZ11_10385 [Curvibacter sp.]
MTLLSKPYPDELIGSVIARGAWHTGLPVKALVRDVFGPQRSYYSLLLGTGFSRLERMTGTDAEELLLSHTVFPYATAYMQLEIREVLKAKALKSSSSEDCLSSITKNVSHGVPYRRVCSLCIQEDMKTYGESYWHRQHHLPGVLVCLRHEVKLHVTTLQVRGRTQVRDSVLPNLIEHVPVETSLPLSQLLAIAKLSVQVLSETFQSESDLRQRLRSKAMELGYKRKSGDVAGHALSIALQRFHGAALLSETGSRLCQRAPWPTLMLQPNILVPFATPKYVLMQAFLEQSPSAAVTVESAYKKPGKLGTDFKRLDTRLSKRLQTAVQKAQQKNLRLTVKELLSGSGSWQIFRHKRKLLPKSAEFIVAFRKSEQSERQIGVRDYWRKRHPARFNQVASES